MRTFFLLFLLCFSFSAFAHDGHHENNQEKKALISENTQNINDELDQEGRPATWLQWIGSFHLILLHFPIALINMLAVSEILLAWFRRPIFEGASRFLLIAAAIVAPPTALLGLIFSYSAPYYGLEATFLVWHMWLGISTALLAVAIAVMREVMGINKLYYACLALLVLMVNATSFFGGGVTFGPFQMLPPP